MTAKVRAFAWTVGATAKGRAFRGWVVDSFNGSLWTPVFPWNLDTNHIIVDQVWVAVARPDTTWSEVPPDVTESQ